MGPRTIQDFHAHLYVPCAVQDFHASIRPLGHIGFTCIYTSLGSFRRPIWPEFFCKFHPLRGLYNRGRGIYHHFYQLPVFLTISAIACIENKDFFKKNGAPPKKKKKKKKK